jgi:AraC-like DNA-binding protein
MKGSITASFVRNLMTAAQHMQMDGARLLKTAKVPASALDDIDESIDEDAVVRLWTAVDQQHPGSLLAPRVIAVAKQSGLGSIGVAGAIMMTCKNVEELSSINERYRNLVGRFIVPSIELRRNGICFSYPVMQSPIGRLRSWNDAKVFSGMMFVQELTGFPWKPLEIHLGHDGRRDGVYDDRLDCPIRFNSPRTRVVFPRELVEQRFRPVPAGIGNYLVRHAEHLLARRSQRRSLSDRIVEKLPLVLSTKRNIAGHIAMELGVTERTMQRYLRSEGTSFAELLARTRQELAERYLDDGDLSITEIAELIGYSDASAFHQAFRRWNQMTPAAYRKRPIGRSLPGSATFRAE